ncbi:ribulose-phosphate 3-epimerase [Clostridium pasteurianum]|uniref:ribulose-phosphate 3-epimerase n=1 Tax=Clostridium pasteurianum TaxID=1501 RepID=UPI002260FF0E|nr:ribulose-phosphate 3-epimerase [Clostridium pasteurianum]UZW13632.1 ribulose-phosphate 3-epimerase [Clostridium pasteurianum]
MTLLINPSLLSADFCNLERDIRILEESNIKSIHIDVMDGSFVSNIAFGICQIKAINRITDMKLDVHLMINNAERYIKTFVEAGADCITVHEEACTHLYKIIQYIKSFGIKAGIALNPSTNINNLRYVFNLVNKVLIMTVEPGFGGQKFISCMKEKIVDTRIIKNKNQYDFEIQVDGGINFENIMGVVNCGATNIVIGSGIFNGGNIKENINKFYSILDPSCIV